MAWWGWGDPDLARPLSPEMSSLVREALGVRRDGPPVPSLEGLDLPESRMPPEVAEHLSQIVGPNQLSAEREPRVGHLRGKSTSDLLRLRLGDLSDAPDLVVMPGSHQEILDVLELCTAERIAVVPFGGGTSVVGGLAPRRGDSFQSMLALDLQRLNRLTGLDEESRLATLEPGLPAAGPRPGWASGDTRSATSASPSSTPLWAALPPPAPVARHRPATAGSTNGWWGSRWPPARGTVELGQAPRSAAGPDLRQPFLGSEGNARRAHVAESRDLPGAGRARYEGWRCLTSPQLRRSWRRFRQDGPAPTDRARLRRSGEPALNLARPGTRRTSAVRVAC